MSFDLLTHLNLYENEIKNFVVDFIPSTESLPSTAKDGRMIYYKRGLYLGDGSKWNQVTDDHLVLASQLDTAPRTLFSKLRGDGISTNIDKLADEDVTGETLVKLTNLYKKLSSADDVEWPTKIGQDILIAWDDTEKKFRPCYIDNNLEIVRAAQAGGVADVLSIRRKGLFIDNGWSISGYLTNKTYPGWFVSEWAANGEQKLINGVSFVLAAGSCKITVYKSGSAITSLTDLEASNTAKYIGSNDGVVHDIFDAVPLKAGDHIKIAISECTTDCQDLTFTVHIRNY